MPLKAVVVVPTYNERENIDALLEALLGLPENLHALVVDDGSPDGTGGRVDEWVHKEPRVGVIHRPGKMGLGTAYIAGFTRALAEGFEAVIEMDADFSHKPAYVPDLLAKAAEYDLVIGSRYIGGGGTSGWGLHRRILSEGANAFARGMLGLKVRDCTAGFRCYTAAALRRIDFSSVLAEGYSFQVEMLVRVLKSGGRVAEIPIIFEERRHGKSKISRAEVFRAIGTVVRLSRER
ncbi:MAG: polyprenol monophosphomannose synthase [Vicinamibacteria bacterium]|nr:polyprenol monophosphomannose synthase [Vicinamibacteria bacterium]